MHREGERERERDEEKDAETTHMSLHINITKYMDKQIDKYIHKNIYIYICIQLYTHIYSHIHTCVNTYVLQTPSKDQEETPAISSSAEASEQHPGIWHNDPRNPTSRKMFGLMQVYISCKSCTTLANPVQENQLSGLPIVFWPFYPEP